MAGSVCDCCGKKSDDAVVACGYGPISVAYCSECTKSGKMPWWNLVTYVSCIGDKPEHVHDGMNEEIKFQCNLHKKTIEEFWEACAEANRKMDEYFEEQKKKDEKEGCEEATKKLDECLEEQSKKCQT